MFAAVYALLVGSACDPLVESRTQMQQKTVLLLTCVVCFLCILATWASVTLLGWTPALWFTGFLFPSIIIYPFLRFRPGKPFPTIVAPLFYVALSIPSSIAAVLVDDNIGIFAAILFGMMLLLLLVYGEHQLWQQLLLVGALWTEAAVMFAEVYHPFGLTEWVKCYTIDVVFTLGGKATISALLVVLTTVVMLAVGHGLKRTRLKEEEGDNTLSALQQFALHVTHYDTRSATSVLEDHEGFVDKKLLQTLEQIVVNLDQYRPFIPAALMIRQEAKLNSPSLRNFRPDGISIPADSTSEEDEPSQVTPSPQASGNFTLNPLQKSPGKSALSMIASDLEITSVDGSENGDDNADTNPLYRAASLAAVSFAEELNMDVLEEEESESEKISINPFAKAFGAAALIQFESVRDPVYRGNETELSVVLHIAVTGLAKLCREHNATLQGMRGSTALVTWGVDFTVRQLHKSVCKFGIALRAANINQDSPKTSQDWVSQASEPCFVSCAIHCGELIYGAAGDSSLKQLCILGPYAKLSASQRLPGNRQGAMASDLELLFEAAKWHNAIVISSDIAQQVQGSFHVRPIDAVKWGERPKEPLFNIKSSLVSPGRLKSKKTLPTPSRQVQPNPLIKVYEVVAPVSASTEEDSRGGGTEWMYNLQQAESSASPFGVCEAMNRALDKYSLGYYEDGSAVLEPLSNQQRRDPRLISLEAHAAACSKRGVSYAREFGWRSLE